MSPHTHAVIHWYSANCCFCHSTPSLASLALCQRCSERVCVCFWRQKDESKAYLLLISPGHRLCFVLTIYIMVTKTHLGSTDSADGLYWWQRCEVTVHPCPANSLLSRFWSWIKVLFSCRVFSHLNVALSSYWDMFIKAAETPCLHPPTGNKQSTNIMKYYHVKYGGLWQE